MSCVFVLAEAKTTYGTRHMILIYYFNII